MLHDAKMDVLIYEFVAANRKMAFMYSSVTVWKEAAYKKKAPVYMLNILSGSVAILDYFQGCSITPKFHLSTPIK